MSLYSCFMLTDFCNCVYLFSLIWDCPAFSTHAPGFISTEFSVNPLSTISKFQTTGLGIYQKF